MNNELLYNLLLSLFVLPALYIIYLRSAHMFQLCSYQNQSYRKYLADNLAETFSAHRVLPLAISAIAALFGKFLIMAFAAVFFVFVNPVRKAKKPLVWTHRVKRLTATVVILFVIFGLVHPALAAVFALLTPYIIMAASAINRPAEEALSRRYIKEAQSLLKQNSGLKIIGITGSYGKTSTKYFLKELLSSRYSVYMTPGNFNTPLGVTRAVREGLRPTHDIFICEMGARHVGDISELCRLFEPDLGIVTSIGPQHLETFGSQENITNEKLELYRAVKDKGGAFLNFDSPIIAAGTYEGKVTSYGSGDNCLYKCSDVTVGPSGSEFTVTVPGGESRRLRTRLLGPANVQNILGAVAVAHSLGVPLDALATAAASLESVPHRLQLVPGGGGLTFIDDAYNANPEGAKAALDTLALCEGMTRVMLTPGMVELGAEESRLNRELGEYAAARCDVAILVDKKRGPDIRQGLLDGGFDEAHIYMCDSLSDGLARARALGGRRMVLLLNDLTDQY